MENETYGFEAWLRFVGRCTANSGLIESLETLASLLERAFGVRVWFVRISGKRWAFLVGTRGTRPGREEVFRTPLSKDTGMVCDSWGYLSRAEQERLVVFLEQLVVDKTLLNCWGGGQNKP